jgi:hypothetical protein
VGLKKGNEQQVQQRSMSKGDDCMRVQQRHAGGGGWHARGTDLPKLRLLLNVRLP